MMSREAVAWHLNAQAELRRRDRMLEFGPHACGIVANTRHGLFVVDPEDSFVSMGLLQGGGYNEVESARLRMFTTMGGDVLVVGAHIGAHTIPLSRTCRKLIAIEANPRAFDYLRVNLDLNHCSNVVAHNVAVSDKVEKIEFLMGRDNSGGSKRMPLIVEDMYVYDKPDIITLETVRLDDLLIERTFDLVLMDIEGSEYFALRGMQEILAGTKVMSVEFVPHHLKNVAGISPDEFLAPILSYFDWLHVFEDGVTIPRKDIPGKVRRIYEEDRQIDGLFFLKGPPPAWLLAGEELTVDPPRASWNYFRHTPLVTDEPPVELSIRDYCDYAQDFLSVGDEIGARMCYQTILRLTDPPDTPLKRIARGGACQFMALEAHDRSGDGTAIDWWHKALMADPLDVNCRLDFVMKGLLPLRLFKVAREELERTMRIAPEDPRVWQIAADVEREDDDGTQEEMDRLVRKALEVGPDNAGSYLVAAHCYADTARFEEATRCYDTILKSWPHRVADAKHGLGIVLDRMGHTKDAIALLDEALELGTDDQTLTRWNRSEMLLSEGRYVEGWADHTIRSDNRYRGRELAALGRLGTRFTVPFWSIDDAPCRVHVHPEMGFGDVICMARYIPFLQRMGHDVRFEVSSRMVGLFAHSLPGVKVMPLAIDYPGALGLQDFDRHVTTMTFPYLFGTTIETVPWDGPYIKADPEKVSEWSQRLWPMLPRGREQGIKPRIGLCWSAGIRPGLWYGEYGRRKSMAFTELAPLLEADATFVSLQTGPERLENSIFPGLEGESPDWSDTAALIANLDLVITVDTAVAHLAGAMGKPTWLLLHCQGTWHWMRERTDSPWYPSVRIFRQEHPHEWTPVVQVIREELERI